MILEVLSFKRDLRQASISKVISTVFLAILALLSIVPAAKADTINAAKLESASQGFIHLSLTPSSPEEKAKEISVSPNAVITLNGSPAGVLDLRSGDELQLHNDREGNCVLVEAIRTRPAIILGVDQTGLRCTSDYLDRFSANINEKTVIQLNGKPAVIGDLQNGDQTEIVAAKDGTALKISVQRRPIINSFIDNIRMNLFKPLLLFFYLGFAIAALKIAFEFPRPIYQGLTIYLLISIGWHGGEELSLLSGSSIGQALLFMILGFITNTLIAMAAYLLLRSFVPSMRKIDSATVAAFYGSDSAGTFVTCLGVLQAAHIACAAYMPVMLAIMEIPGCLAGLYLVSRLRKQGMDANGNMPGEKHYDAASVPIKKLAVAASLMRARESALAIARARDAGLREAIASTSPGVNTSEAPMVGAEIGSGRDTNEKTGTFTAKRPPRPADALDEDDQPHEVHNDGDNGPGKVLKEVFLNPGIALLFGGIIIGFLSRSQGYKVVQPDDQLFIGLFQGYLCLFLLEMGMTAAKRLQDLKSANWRFIAFGLLAPNLFAVAGLAISCIFAHVTHQPLQLGTYVLFAVLCASASYIAVPAIQRMAIPEASPTLPLAASLGLTFSYNVTIGIPLYLIIAQEMLKAFPVI